MKALSLELPRPFDGGQLHKLVARELADSAGLTLATETERLFLGKIHHCIFSMQGRISGQFDESASATFAFGGFIKKRNLRVVNADSAARSLAETIVVTPRVQQEIMPLDLRRLELHLCSDHWRLRVMLVGAAFVDMRLPPARRYIPLGATQANALPRALTAISVVLQDYFARNGHAGL